MSVDAHFDDMTQSIFWRQSDVLETPGMPLVAAETPATSSHSLFVSPNNWSSRQEKLTRQL